MGVRGVSTAPLRNRTSGGVGKAMLKSFSKYILDWGSMEIKTVKVPALMECIRNKINTKYAEKKW